MSWGGSESYSGKEDHEEDEELTASWFADWESQDNREISSFAHQTEEEFGLGALIEKVCERMLHGGEIVKTIASHLHETNP